MVSHSGSRASRRSRGGANRNRFALAQTDRYRGGKIPYAPGFDGDTDKDPRCYKKWLRSIEIWRRLATPCAPPGELSLRLLERLSGDAADLIEYNDPLEYDHVDGIQKLIKEMEVFDQKPVHEIGGVVRRYENIARAQGESITKFIRRLGKLEKELYAKGFKDYPEYARVVKLLDGCKIDERSMQIVLGSAGNRYEWQAIRTALEVHYPPGRTLSGHERGNNATHKPGHPKEGARVRFNNQEQNRDGQPRRTYQAWITEHDDGSIEVLDGDPPSETQEAADQEAGDETDEMNDYMQLMTESLERIQHLMDDDDDLRANMGDDLQVLTATSEKLKHVTQARGFFRPKAKAAPHASKRFFPPSGSGGNSNAPTRRNLEKRGVILKADTKCLDCTKVGHWRGDAECQWVRDGRTPARKPREATMADHVPAPVNTAPSSAPAVQFMTEHASAASSPSGLWYESQAYNGRGCFEQLPVFTVPCMSPDIIYLTLRDETVSAYLVFDSGCQKCCHGPTWFQRRNSALTSVSANAAGRQLVPLRRCPGHAKHRPTPNPYRHRHVRRRDPYVPR